MIRFEIGAFDREATVIGGDTYYRLQCGDEGVLHNADEPALPKLSRSIIIPDDARMTINVLSAEYTTSTACSSGPVHIGWARSCARREESLSDSVC